MAKLFFFVAVALVLVSASAARHAPVPATAEQEGVVVPAASSQVDAADAAQFRINIGSGIGDNGTVRCPKVSPKDCMLGILQEASNIPYCKGRCNIFIHNDERGFTFTTVTRPKVFYREMFFVESHRYQIYLFHGPAYFQTWGWYGWGNWAFSGNFSHVPNTGVVEFFPYQ